MSEPTFNPLRPVRPVEPVTTGKRPAAAAQPRAPAFEALLERLETQARALEQQSRTVSGASELADAVGRAHETLATALSFGDRVLEAFRQAVQQRGTTLDPAATDATSSSAPDPSSGPADTDPSSAR